LLRSERLARRPRFETVRVTSRNVKYVEVTSIFEPRGERRDRRCQRFDERAHVVSDDDSRATSVMDGLDGFLGCLLSVEARGRVVAGCGRDPCVGNVLARRT
jgi:hypothetical protein